MHIHFIQHATFEYPGSLLDWASMRNHTISITNVFENTSFPALEEVDMLIIMGGPMGVYEEALYPWLRPEKAFIKQAIQSHKKVWGICLGAQLAAEALGSIVQPYTHKEIGWWPVEKVNGHPLTDSLPKEITTFHWHGDRFSLPPDAIQLFKSQACDQQGFIYNNQVLGLQFHMEVKTDLLENMTEHEKSELIKSTYIQTEQEINELSKTWLTIQHQMMYDLADAFVAL